MTLETPWIAVEDVCHMYGVTFAAALNKIRAGRFDVPTYKVGKRHVIDRKVHERYFEIQRQIGLQALDSTEC